MGKANCADCSEEGIRHCKMNFTGYGQGKLCRLQGEKVQLKENYYGALSLLTQSLICWLKTLG